MSPAVLFLGLLTLACQANRQAISHCKKTAVADTLGTVQANHHFRMTRVIMQQSHLLFSALLLIFLCLFPGVDLQANPPTKVRFATFNVSLNRPTRGQLQHDLENHGNLQARRIAEIIQQVQPDVLLINEFDYDAAEIAADRFQHNFLEVSQNGRKPIRYDYRFLAPVNTGVPSGMDLDANGRTEGAADAFGFGHFPGQYGMMVLSRYPIQSKKVRTFQKFLWQDMPRAKQPRNPDGSLFYSKETMKYFRLSSKSHWDIPVELDKGTIHFLVAHPTPPVFDGNEDRNGCRNHDEIRLFADYVDPQQSHYLVDDQGKHGGLSKEALFVIAGDMNADPYDGDGLHHAARQLTEHPLVNRLMIPISLGGQQAAQQGNANQQHHGKAAHDTADFPDAASGNLRVDYVLPSKTLQPLAAGVYWPNQDRHGAELLTASDHRLVWLDVVNIAPR